MLSNSEVFKVVGGGKQWKD